MVVTSPASRHMHRVARRRAIVSHGLCTVFAVHTAAIAPIGAQSPAPPRVARPGFVYDPVHRVTVLFGGVSDDGVYPGTWEWNGSSWRERRVPGPSPRANHGMVYDSRRHVMVLFGGESPDGNTLGDSWEYDGVAWRKVAETGPQRRAGFGIAYDSARGRTIVHGGFVDGRMPPLTDTWAWDGTSWKRIATVGPSGSTFHRMAYDARRNRVVAFGGRGGGSETWELVDTTWLKVSSSGPPPRDHHAMAYDADRLRVVMFGGGRQLPTGGYDRSALWLTDLWEWDGTSWKPLAEEGPPSRGGQPGMTYDLARHRLVLFGGGWLDGLWEWSGTGWERKS